MSTEMTPDLPAPGPKSIYAILSRWLQMHEFGGVNRERESLDLLIGCDVLEAD